MPETTLIYGRTDEQELAEFLFAEGCSLVPDYFYSSPSHLAIRTIDEFIESRTSSGRFASHRIAVQFFVLGPWPQTEQLYFRPIEREKQQVFYISQREGAFALMLGLPVPEMVDNKERLKLGSVSHWPKYWSRACEAEVSPPREMNEFYKKTRGFIVRNSRPYRMHGKVYRMGVSAAEELAAGRALVFDCSDSPPKSTPQ